MLLIFWLQLGVDLFSLSLSYCFFSCDLPHIMSWNVSSDVNKVKLNSKKRYQGQ